MYPHTQCRKTAPRATSCFSVWLASTCPRTVLHLVKYSLHRPKDLFARSTVTAELHTDSSARPLILEACRRRQKSSRRRKLVEVISETRAVSSSAEMRTPAVNRRNADATSNRRCCGTEQRIRGKESVMQGKPMQYYPLQRCLTVGETKCNRNMSEKSFIDVTCKTAVQPTRTSDKRVELTLSATIVCTLDSLNAVAQRLTVCVICNRRRRRHFSRTVLA